MNKNATRAESCRVAQQPDQYPDPLDKNNRGKNNLWNSGETNNLILISSIFVVVV